MRFDTVVKFTSFFCMLLLGVLQTDAVDTMIGYSPLGYSVEESPIGDKINFNITLDNFPPDEKILGFGFKVYYDKTVMYMDNLQMDFPLLGQSGDIDVTPMNTNFGLSKATIYGQWNRQHAIYHPGDAGYAEPTEHLDRFDNPNDIEEISFGWSTTDEADALVTPDAVEETVLLTLEMTVVDNATTPIVFLDDPSLTGVGAGGQGIDLPVTVAPPSDFSLPVELSMFTAVWYPDSIDVIWEAESQRENLGWNLYRSESKDEEFEKINAQVVEGAGTTAISKTYKFIDRDAKRGKPYFYYLESISFDGETNKTNIIGVSLANVSLSWGAIKHIALLSRRSAPSLTASRPITIVKVYDRKGNFLRIQKRAGE